MGALNACRWPESPSPAKRERGWGEGSCKGTVPFEEPSPSALSRFAGEGT